MRGMLREGLLLIGLMLVLAQGVPAFSVSNVTINPSGPVTPGTPVSITGMIDFEPTPTFPTGEELQYSTDLKNAKWSHTFFADGVEIEQKYRDWYLSYPSFSSASEKFTCAGTAPDVTRTTNITLFRICEYDAHGNLVPGSCFNRTAVVVYMGDVRDRIKNIEVNLSRFRSHIDEKAAMGVDTTGAEAKYAEADQHLKSASHMDSGRYLDRYKDLELAETDIAEGEHLLDRAWAEKELADAKVPVQNAERVIEWFTGNASTRDDPQLRTIMTKREVALSYLTTAEEELARGNYSQARETAENAFNKGNESYTDALQRSGEIQNPDYFSQILWFGIPPPCKCGPVFAAFELAIAVVITGIKMAVLILPVLGVYYIWRKRKGAKPG